MNAPIMRLTIRFQFPLILAGFLIVSAHNLPAQQAKAPAQKGATAKQPVPIQKAAPAVDPLDQVLDSWEAASSKIKSLHGKQSRSEFNKTYEVETVTEGSFFLEMPDKGRIDFGSVNLKKDAVSARKKKRPEIQAGDAPSKKDDPKNIYYGLQSGDPQRWICTGDTIIEIDDRLKTYAKEEIPPELRGKNIVESPLPFLFGMKAEDAKGRFKLSIVTETKDSVMLLAIPKMAKDIENYEKAAITLDKKTWLPTKVHLLSQSQDETVYTFQSVVVNDSDFKSRMTKLFNLDKDPFDPVLKGYTLALRPAEAPVVRPAARTTPSTRPAGNSDSAPQRTAQPPRDTQRR